MNRQLVILLVTLVLCAEQSFGAPLRGLYIWNTSSQINSTTEVNRLINESITSQVTDIYIWAHGYLVNPTNIAYMQAFISKAYCNNIRVWAMDGDRSYLADWSGPASYYNFITDVINYNSTAAVNQKFYGVHADIEPQDGQGEPRSSFHNGIQDSGLNGSGGGVWQTSEVLDREKLMVSWLDIMNYSFTTCHANALKFGMSVPSWTDNYYGEEIQCSYPTVHQGVYKYIMQGVDDYCIMSYRTTPGAVGVGNSVIDICNGELSYADGLPAASRPLVWTGLEVHCGVGPLISYCDHASKNSKAAFWLDVATIESALSSHVSYAGMNIHDWKGGWDMLSPAATDVSDPGCNPLPVTYLHIKARVENNLATMEWSTATETNSQSFDIQEIQSDGSFITIATVPASGNTHQVMNYKWQGNQIINRSTYYRIKQIDINNQFTLSPIFEIHHEIEGVSIYIKNNEQLVVSNNRKEATQINLILVNVYGKTILSISFKLDHEEEKLENLNELTAGAYFVHYSYTDSQQYNVLKIIKQ
jgi:hypothetical protein